MEFRRRRQVRRARRDAYVERVFGQFFQKESDTAAGSPENVGGDR
jgi:hypothetical protein